MDKKPIIIAISSALIGAGVVYFSVPTKIKTVTEVKTQEKVVNQKVYIDRVITKITKPDGTIEERTEEKDRSIVDSKEKIREESKIVEVINPKNFTLGVMYKSDLTNIQDNILKPYDQIGVWVTYQTGIFSTELIGGVFYDRTVFIGIGFTF